MHRKNNAYQHIILKRGLTRIQSSIHIRICVFVYLKSKSRNHSQHMSIKYTAHMACGGTHFIPTRAQNGNTLSDRRRHDLVRATHVVFGVPTLHVLCMQKHNNIDPYVHACVLLGDRSVRSGSVWCLVCAGAAFNIASALMAGLAHCHYRLR